MRPVRSAAAPASGITKIDRMTDADTQYAKKEPALRGIPSGCTNPSASAAALATDVR